MKRIWMILLLCCLCFAGCGEKSSRYMKTAEEHYAKGEYEEAAYNYIRAIEEDKDNVAAAIGGFTYGVSTLEMASAYAAFGNNAGKDDPFLGAGHLKHLLRLHGGVGGFNGNRIFFRK